MSTTYTASTFTASQEPPNEQRLMEPSHHASLENHINGPRTAAPWFSSLGEHPGRTHRSGSPQLHHFLKADGPPATSEAQKSSNVTVAGPSRLRSSSADFTLLQGQTIGYDTAFTLDSAGRTPKLLQEARAQKRARQSPTSALPAPTSSWSASSTTRPQSPRGSPSRSLKPRESADEQQRDDVDPVASKGGDDGQNSDQVPPAETAQALERQVQSMVEGAPPEALAALERQVQIIIADGISRGTMDPALRDGVTTPAIRLSPTAASTSSSSSAFSSPQSVAYSDKTEDTDVTSHGDHVDGDETPVAHVPVDPMERLCSPTDKRRSHGPDRDRYGTPEMPRGSAKLPHIPANDLTPRVPNQGHPMHLPRAEKLPLSGYELLASAVSSSSSAASSRNRTSAYLRSSGSPRKRSSRRYSTASLVSAQPCQAEEDLAAIKPIYRRFEALNHRLLLHLQDELSELEEQLHRLDTTDTQTRRVQSHILPASRRAEFLAGGELQWHKTDILGKIAFKLGQYNHTLSSFTSTRDLPAPSSFDVDEYRNYLATRRPISDAETRFLDSADDLITLAANDDGSADSLDNGTRPDSAHEYLHSLRINDEPVVTPIPGTMHGNSWLVRHNRVSSGSRSPGGSAASSSPRFATRPHLLEPPPGSPGAPPSPLRQRHARPSLGEKKAARETGVPAASPGAASHGVSTMAAAAVLLPVLGFAVVPGFAARMVIVLLVALSVFNPVGALRSKQGSSLRRGDMARSMVTYSAVMAIAAAVTR